MRWAFKIAYLGEGFHGSQRQPGLRTVEGELLRVLQSQGVIDDPRHSRFQAASRTDRGVSALGNVIAFDSTLDPRKVMSLVNPRVTDLWMYAYQRVSEDFKPRNARERWYRYYLTGDLNEGRLREAALLLQGKHDFRTFSKGGGGGTCLVQSVGLHRVGRWIALDVIADRFLWNMVRRLARALQLYADGSLRLEEFKAALEGGPLRLEPAPPEYLWLMDVRYDFEFRAFAPKRVEEKLASFMARRSLQASLIEGLLQRLSAGSGEPPAESQPGQEDSGDG
jgi:tRNA pseudouridine38-40 synthase